MQSQILSEARKYEYEEGNRITPEERPLFHLTPRAGWMNDPNGFSQYNGVFHLFYQYYPYQKKWGPMHWGHAVSKDLLRWEFLPAALAPDTPSDAGGCFSGSAEVLDDGRHILMYTGVVKIDDMKEDTFLQRQCIAVGDGTEYQKYEGNPVLDENDIPAGSSKYDFRDPKIWREKDGTFRCVAGNCTPDKNGRILYFRSDDGFDWKFVSILAENDGTLGTMWECPDFFKLGNKYLLITSPQDVIHSDQYNCGNITVCMIGTFDEENGKFSKESVQLIDAGIDFYAAQTLLSDDGRRIMTAWMQNWDSIVYTERHIPWFGQMTLPRELELRGGRLIQKPVRELEDLRTNPFILKETEVKGIFRKEELSGRTVDMTIDIRPVFKDSYRKFVIRFAEKGSIYTSLTYIPKDNELRFSRLHSGTRRSVVHTAECITADKNDRIRLRIILDRYSAEVFINDGEQTMSNVIMTDQSADGISLYADGTALIDLEKYDLKG